jgi:S1-C subfamily serine protease
MLDASPAGDHDANAVSWQAEAKPTATSPRTDGPTAPPNGARRRWRSVVARLAPFAGGVVAALVAVALWSTAFPPAKPLTQTQVNDAIASALASVTPPPAASETAWARIAPSVVVVQATLGASPGGSAAPSAGTSAAPGGASSAPNAGRTSLGSGVVVDDQGDIMTALHVVDGATSITVTFIDGTTAQAVVSQTHPELDLAVLQAASVPSGVVPATLGNPGAIQVGSEVYAVGSPFGLADSMSAGVVSALSRSFTAPNGQKLTGLFQIDAAVNPGNSGGPLINRDGQVVGMVDALVNPTDQDVFVGVGLAVPIDVAGGAAGLPQY